MYIPSRFNPKVLQVASGEYAVVWMEITVAKFRVYSQAKAFRRKIRSFTLYITKSVGIFAQGLLAAFTKYLVGAQSDVAGFIPKVPELPTANPNVFVDVPPPINIVIPPLVIGR